MSSQRGNPPDPLDGLNGRDCRTFVHDVHDEYRVFTTTRRHSILHALCLEMSMDIMDTDREKSLKRNLFFGSSRRLDWVSHFKTEKKRKPANARIHAPLAASSSLVRSGALGPSFRHWGRGMSNSENTLLGSCNFNFDEVDQRFLAHQPPEEDTPDEAKLRKELEQGRASPEADILREMIHQVVIGKDCSKMSFDHIGKRFVSLAWLLELDGLGGRSLTDLAKELGTSRAVLSYHVRTLNGVFNGMRCRGQKLNTARASYRDTAKKSWREGKRSKQGMQN